MSVLDRFLRYVAIDTRVGRGLDERARARPGSWCCMRILAAELERIGLDDVTLDEHGYLMATIPATDDARACRPSASSRTSTRRPRCRAPTCARSCTPPTTAATSCCPTTLRPSCALSEQPGLAAQVGHDIVTASGLTLLGADDKAGVAEIVTAAEYLMRASGDSARADPHRASRRTRRSAAARITSTSQRFGAVVRLHARRRHRAASSSTRASPPTR